MKDSYNDRLRICHITISHGRYDVRIFHKECKSLAKNGYDVSLYVADNNIDENVNNVKIKSITSYKNSYERFWKAPRAVLSKAKEEAFDLYHIHDPELLMHISILTNAGKRVILDLHEDMPAAILNRSWFNAFARRIVSMIYKKIEELKVKTANGLVIVSTTTYDRLVKINRNATIIDNYPILEEFELKTERANNKELCYVGAINRVRGIKSLIEAIHCSSAKRLNLAGKFEDNKFYEELSSMPGWKKVEFYNLVDRDKLSMIYERSSIGVIPFLAIPNHMAASPNKIYEYMAAGLPVLASNLPGMEKVISKSGCGIVFEAGDYREMAKRIDEMINSMELLKEFSIKAKSAIKNDFNWISQEKKLLSFYKSILKGHYS